jgi:predicted TPR repeat methyltransferase
VNDDSTFTRARDAFLAGVAHYEAGRLAEAEQQFLAALALVPGRPSTLTNLGAVQVKLGRFDAAIGHLRQAVAQEPANAEAWGHLGVALAERGRLPDAIDAFDRTLALQPKQAAAWMFRGNALRELGRADEAAASYEHALANGGDDTLIRYYLAALRGGRTPTATPRQYVQALFDGYAGEFDTHLVQALRYDGPQVIADRIAQLGRRFARALDLGCGTGLCAPLLAPVCDAIDGVDLSANMLDQARARGVYDALAQGDLVEHLGATPQRYELAVAADVLIYLGDLGPLFTGVRRVLAPGGVFAFSVEEEAGDADFTLRPSLRYAHSEGYVRALAVQHGFDMLELRHRPVREDQRVPVPGMFCWLRLRA